MAKVALVQEAPPEVADAAAAPKGKKKLFVILAAVVLLASGGGAAWYFMGHSKDAAHKEEKAKVEAPPVFLPVDQFTVNLNPEGGDQFLQAAFTLQVTDNEVVEAIKLRLPDVRNRILLLLSSKKASELTTVDGKQKLANEIMQVSNDAIAPSFPVAKKAETSKKGEKGEKSEKSAEHPKAEAKSDAAKDEAPKAEGEAKAVDAAKADALKADSDAKAADAAKADAAKAAPPKPAKPVEKPEHGVTAVLITHFIIQ
jgi:flagellar protein FliL